MTPNRSILAATLVAGAVIGVGLTMSSNWQSCSSAEQEPAPAVLPVSTPAGVGVARASLENALNYAKERVQFGKPISAFQNTGFKLAALAPNVAAARLLVWQSANFAHR